MTKTFVATAVLQLAEQGKVDLDAHPRRYLPYFQPADPRAERLTIRQVLAHVSGLQKDNDTRFDNPEFDDGALERLVREAVSRPLDFAPGEKFGYSNLGYCVLGDIVAKVSGETFEAYVKRHILEPLRMKNSTLLLSEVKRGPWARPYVVDDTYTVVPAPFYPYNRRRAPSAAMSSTLNDMERWALVHLNRGELEGRRILKASTYDEMWRPAGESFQQIGLGWFLWKRGAERVVGHNGSDTGFVADMELLPERGIGVIVLCNLDHGPYRQLMLAALDAALGKTPEVVFKPSLAKGIYQVVVAQGAGAAVARYREIKREQPGRYDFNEWVLNGLGYKLVGRGKLEEAVHILRLNVEEYPASSNVYDSLGDAAIGQATRPVPCRTTARPWRRTPGTRRPRRWWRSSSRRATRLRRHRPASGGAVQTRAAASASSTSVQPTAHLIRGPDGSTRSHVSDRQAHSSGPKRKRRARPDTPRPAGRRRRVPSGWSGCCRTGPGGPGRSRRRRARRSRSAPRRC